MNYFYLYNLYLKNIAKLITFSQVIIILTALIVFVCLILIIFGLFHKPKPIALSSLNVRVYSYNVETEEFRFFDKNNLSNMRSYSSSQFYAQFVTSDQDKIKAWIESIKEGKVVSETIQVNVKIRSNLSSLPSMLEFTSYNENSKLIHFESYIVPHLSKIDIDFKANIGYRKFFILENIDRCQEFVDKKAEDRIVAYYNFKIYFSNKGFSDDENLIDLKDINNQLRKILVQFLNKDTKMYYINDTEQLIIDKSISSRTIAQNVGNTYASTLKHFIAFSVKVPYVKIALSITLSTYCDNNVRKALSQNESMINLIINDLKTDKVIIYDQNILDKNNVEQTNLRDVKMLIKNSTFRLYFEPTLDIQKAKQTFFSLKFIPYGTSMKSLSEIVSFCEKMPGANENIYNSIFEKLRTRINDDTPKDILIRLPLNQINTFIDTYNMNYSDLGIRWIIGIREKELIELINEIDIALNFANLIQEKHCEFAIFFHDATTILPRGLLSKANYFIFDNESNEALTADDLQANLRVIKSNLSIYEGKICFLNLKTIADIELFAHYCGTIFHCDELKLRSSTLEALDYDKIKLVVSQTKHFIPQNNKISIDMYNDLSQQKDVFSKSSPRLLRKRKRRG